jgi:TRAP-type C4-dicarboxylate transport system permease small subunit
MSASSPSNLRKISRFLGNIEQWVLVLLLGFLTAFAVTQIVLRNFLSAGLVWGDDLLRHGVLWISLLGATRATLERKHIRIDLLPRILPARLGLMADSLCCFISLFVCVLLTWASWNFVQGERLGGDIAFASIPYWWLVLIFPISFGLMAFRFCLNCISRLIRRPEGVER